MVHSQAIKNTQLVQPQQTSIIIVIYWPLCVYARARVARVYANYVFIKVDGREY